MPQPGHSLSNNNFEGQRDCPESKYVAGSSSNKKGMRTQIASLILFNIPIILNNF